MFGGCLGFWRQIWRGWAFALSLLLSAIPVAFAASAVELAHNESGAPFSDYLCYHVAPLSDQVEALPRQTFRCDGVPEGYQSASLWLEIKPATAGDAELSPEILIRQTRFSALHVGYLYADGSQQWQSVRNGNYGDHWRVGAQLAFSPKDHHVAVDRILLRFDHLADHSLVHIRLMDRDGAMQQNVKVAAIIAAAMMLLLISGLYSLAIARTQTRKASTYWQGLWSITMLVWAALWSQTHLIFFPGMAGILSLQLGVILSCFCIAFATFAAVTAAASDKQHRFYPKAAMVLSSCIILCSIPFSFLHAHHIEWFDNILAGMILLNIALILAALIHSMRRGSAQARSMLVAWCVPMAALFLISVVDMERHFWGSGSKLLVLMTAIWYALWLSITSARRLYAVAKERDNAQKMAESAMLLAVLDPLTGLYNRRGFIELAHDLLEQAKAEGKASALLLLDVDRFKSVNDVYGHEVGDHVLCGVAASMQQWDQPNCICARIGGEEFALLVVGLSGQELLDFAEKVRCSVRDWKSVQRLVGHPVTVSIGVSEAHVATDFETLYPLADRALYAAKHTGRDRVVVEAVEPTEWVDSTSDQIVLIK